MVLISVILQILINQSFAANSKLPILATKQSVNNIRFLSSQGKFTYYQRRSGSLLLSTNYKVSELLSAKKGTSYEMVSSPNKKRILITQNKNFHEFLSIRNPKTIYSVDYGEVKTKEIGKGISPAIHLNDTWASFYDSYKRTLFFQNINSESLKFSIKLSNKKNPYFIPQSLMIGSDLILYTDVNKNGFPGVIKYDRKNNKFFPIHKLPSQTTKIEICKYKDSILIGEFGLDTTEKTSIISMLPSINTPIEERVILYESTKNDIGNMVCDIKGEFIYFIKNVTSDSGKLLYEAARLNVKSKKIDIISDVSFAHQIINMDGKLLLPYQGKFYVLLGEDNMTKFDLINSTKE